MVKITVSADCGNAPKKIFLKDLNVAFVEGRLDFIAERVRDEIVWNLVGSQVIEGKPQVMEALERRTNNSITELILTTIITHGDEGAVSGEIVTTEGKHYDFCHVCTFSGAKGTHLKAVRSFIIRTDRQT